MRKSCQPWIYLECRDCYLLKFIVGKSYAYQTLTKNLASILNENSPVLISGESGTGKELVAKALHYSSCCLKKNGFFISKSLGGINEDAEINQTIDQIKELFNVSSIHQTIMPVNKLASFLLRFKLGFLG